MVFWEIRDFRIQEEEKIGGKIDYRVLIDFSPVDINFVSASIGKLDMSSMATK